MIAFFDESGKPEDKPIVSLGAVVATNLKWCKFDVRWRHELTRNKAAIHHSFGVPWFHMTDFESQHAKPYNEWKRDKRISFLASLARITKDAITFGTVHSLVVSDWNEIIVPRLETNFKKKRGWYIFLLQAVLQDIARFVRPPRHSTINCVFDESKEFANAARLHYAELKASQNWEDIFGSSTYDRSPRLPGLQAADMLAFEGRRAVENKVMANNVRPIRKLLDNLTNRKQITVARYTREDLIDFHGRWMAVKQYREALLREPAHNTKF
jgi:hypothetical protein